MSGQQCRRLWDATFCGVSFWVYTVCPGLSIQIHTVNTVNFFLFFCNLFFSFSTNIQEAFTRPTHKLIIQSTPLYQHLIRSTKFVIMTSWLAQSLCWKGDSQTFCQNILFITLRNICSRYLFELPQLCDSNKYPNVYVSRGISSS